jgi:hypothetical protein
MDESRTPHVTHKVDLPGGKMRLREAALYVMAKSANLDFFGLTKLNKILWKADFSAFAARRVPVTGRLYQRLENGPAPVEMRPLLDEMVRDGLVRIDLRPAGRYTEQRPVALTEPSLRYFSPDDLSYLDAAIEAYSNHSGSEVSRASHGVAWGTRKNGDPMPYDLALLSDEPLSDGDLERFFEFGRDRLWRSG